jgi:hypothetical protein
MEILNKNELIDRYDAFMCNRNTLKKEGNEIAICFNREHKVFNYINNIEMKEQLKSWRKMLKQKQIEILEGNNLKVFDLRGRPFFILVITPTDETYNAIDPFGLVLYYAVSGFIYAFDNKADRDNCYNYLNKIQSKMSNETE